MSMMPWKPNDSFSHETTILFILESIAEKSQTFRAHHQPGLIELLKTFQDRQLAEHSHIAGCIHLRYKIPVVDSWATAAALMIVHHIQLSSAQNPCWLLLYDVILSNMVGIIAIRYGNPTNQWARNPWAGKSVLNQPVFVGNHGRINQQVLVVKLDANSPGASADGMVWWWLLAPAHFERRDGGHCVRGPG